jgi:Tfp pilus assembly protein PilN
MIEINLLPKDYLKSSRSFSLGKSGLYVFAGAIGVVVMLIVVTFYQMRQVNTLESNIQKANERAAMLQKDIKLVDGLLDVKTKINQRMAAVEKLDRHRTVWVRLLQDVASNVPDFVWLAEFREVQPKAAAAQSTTYQPGKAMPSSTPTTPQPSGPNTTQANLNGAAEKAPEADSLTSFSPAEIEGYAFTLNALAAFMINLMRSDYFDNVELVSSKETKFNGDDKAYNFVVSCNVHYLTEEQLRAMVAQAKENVDNNEADYEEAAPPSALAASSAENQN